MCRSRTKEEKERAAHPELMTDVLATTLTVPAASAAASSKEATSAKEGAEEVLRTSSAFGETLLAVLVVELPLLGVRENIVGTNGPGGGERGGGGLRRWRVGNRGGKGRLTR